MPNRCRSLDPWERRHRWIARLARQRPGSDRARRPARLPLAMDPPTGYDAPWARIDYPLPEVRLLQEYLRIDTSAPDGDEVAAARFLAARLAEVNIDSELIRLGNG